MKRVLLLFLLAAAAFAQGPPDTSFGLRNGRWWQGISLDLKTGYLYGLLDGITIGDGDRKGLECGGLLSFRELIKGIDQIYERPENAAVPIHSAATAFCLTFKGSAPDLVESFLMNIRKAVAEQSQKDQKAGTK